jgi:hypothetical protein
VPLPLTVIRCRASGLKAMLLNLLPGRPSRIVTRVTLVSGSCRWTAPSAVVANVLPSRPGRRRRRDDPERYHRPRFLPRLCPCRCALRSPRPRWGGPKCATKARRVGVWPDRSPQFSFRRARPNRSQARPLAPRTDSTSDAEHMLRRVGPARGPSAGAVLGRWRACLAERTRRPPSCFQLPLRERTEHVVVAGRGVVAEDQGERVEVEVTQVVDPAADALAGAAARAPFAAAGTVFGDGAASEPER